jgi:hypothetical protein
MGLDATGNSDMLHCSLFEIVKAIPDEQSSQHGG